MSEPLDRLWAALEAHDCRPRGRSSYDFRARCPGHGGRNPSSLHVSVGADGRALLRCHAHQCDVDTITAALGLSVADLFPPGHHLGRRWSPRPVRRGDFRGPALSVANALAALERLKEPWRAMITSDCPYCGSQGAWLHVRSPGHVLGNGLIDQHGGVEVDCPLGCDSGEYTQALLGRLEADEAGR